MEHLPPPTTAPAGWYPDAVTRGLRYFDGVRWHDAVVSSVGSAQGEHGFVFEEVEEHPHLPVSVAVGALAVLVVSLVVGKSVVEALAGRDWPLVVYIAISALLSYGPSIGWLWYVRGRWGSGRFGAVGWRFRWVDLAWGPITWAAAIGVQILLAAAVLVFDIPLSSNVDSISDGDADRAYLVATAIAAVIAAPIVEELVFRGLVLRGLLSRLGPVLAVGLQGVLFGVAHVDPARGVGNLGLAIVLSGVGIALGTTAYLTRRLGAVVIAHAIFNGVVVAILLSGALDDVDRSIFEQRSAGLGAAQLAVVDETDVAEPGRREHHRGAVGPLDVGERLGVDQLDVLEAGTGFGVDHPHGGRLQGGRIELSAGVGVGRGPQRP